MARDKRLIPGLRPVLIAIVAGLGAGALAVYVSGGPEGSGLPAVPVPPALSEADTAACAARGPAAKVLAAAATGEVAAMSPADPPQSLKALAFNDPSGKPITLADFGGRKVLVNLWATWCAPCRAEMPALDQLQEQAGGAGFEVVAVNVDTGDDSKPKAFLQETGIRHLRTYRDNTLRLFNKLKSRGLALGLPVTLLVDGDGCLLAQMNGPAEWSSADALRFIEAAKRL